MRLPLALALLTSTPAAHAQTPTVPAARADHLSIAVANADASVAFYQRMFGLPERPAPVKGPRWLDLGDGMAVHLFPGRTASVSPDHRNHLAFAVSDFHAFVQRPERDGIPFTDLEGRPATVQRVSGDGVRQPFFAIRTGAGSTSTTSPDLRADE